MQAAISRRSKSANFTEEEEDNLLKLVHKYRGYIENKKTDAVTNVEKSVGWEKIAAEFNSLANSQIRSVDSLKNKYKNKKKEMRKTYAESMTNTEEDVLIELLHKYEDAISNEITDADSINANMSAWMSLTEEFNSILTESEASMEYLQNMYQVMKKKSTKNYGRTKKHAKETGGGEARDYVSPRDEQMKVLLGVSLTGHDDTDAVYDEDFGDLHPRAQRSLSLQESLLIEEEEIEDIMSMDYTQQLPGGSGLQTRVPIPQKKAPSSSLGAGVNSNEDPKNQFSKKFSVNLLRKPRSVVLKQPLGPINKLNIQANVSPPVSAANVTPSAARGTPAVSASVTLPTPSTPQTGGSRKRAYETQISNWASGKAQLVQVQQEAFVKRQNQEARFRQEEHNLKMEFEKKIYEARLTEIENRTDHEKKKFEAELLLLKKK